MDDPIAVTLERAAGAALFARATAREFTRRLVVGIGSVGGAGVHGLSE